MKPLLATAIASLLLFGTAPPSASSSADVELTEAGRVTSPAIARRDTPQRVNHPPGATIQAIYVTPAGDWAFLPERHFIRAEKVTILAAPPGVYLVTAGDSSILKVVDDGEPSPQPSPDPGPEPQPRPEPEPEPGPAPIVATWAVWIEEQADRAKHVEATAVMTDAKLRRDLEDRGLKVRVYDDDQPEARALLGPTDGVRPAFLLMEEGGAIRSFPAPTTAEQLEQIIRENVVR